MGRLIAAVILSAFLVGTASAEVVGRVNDWLIIKDKKGYEIVKEQPKKVQAEMRERRPRPKTSLKDIETFYKNRYRNKKARKEDRRLKVYREIIQRLKKGEGEPVYSRIKGFDVERVLDAGPFFGAVISGTKNPGALKKAFKLVEKVGNKYFVVGEWR